MICSAICSRRCSGPWVLGEVLAELSGVWGEGVVVSSVARKGEVAYGVGCISQCPRPFETPPADECHPRQPTQP